MIVRTHGVATVAIAAVVASLAIVSLGGCTRGATDDGPNTITVQVQSGSEQQFSQFTKVFKQQNPGVTVKTTSVAQTAKTGSNLTVLTGGDPPDVAIVPTNTQVYSRMLTAKQLVPLGDVWEKDHLQAAYGTQLASTLKSNNTPYVVSYDRTLYCIVYYNQKLFAKLGITPPANHRLASLSDLVKITQTLKKAGVQGLAIGAADNYQASWMIDSYLQSAGSPRQYGNLLASWQRSVPVTTKYTNPPFVKAVAQVQQMGLDKVFQNGYLGQKVTQSEATFLQGKAGMLLDGNYTVSVLKSEGLKFRLGWMLLPPTNPTGKTDISLYTGDTLAIPQKAPHKELAKKYLESVMSVQGQRAQIAGGQLPAIATIPSSAYKSVSPIVQQELGDIAANGAKVGWTSAVPGGLGQQFTDPMVQAMLNKQTTPRAIAAKVQAQLETTRSGG